MTLGDTLMWLAERVEATREPLVALAQDPNAETIRRAFAALRSAKLGVSTLVDDLGREYPEALIAAVLPGVRFPADLDVRTWRPLKYVPNWHGDLVIGADAECGATVTVATRRGADALAALDREQRAAITSLDMLAKPDDVAAVIAGLPFDGVRSIDAGEMAAARAAELILRCPAVEKYAGRNITADVADALATTALRESYLPDIDDDCLARLAGVTRLAKLSLHRRDGARFTARGLAQLVRLPALRVLSLSLCDIIDDEVAVIAELAALEELQLADNPFGDAGGVALGRMHALRVLDVSDTRIGDPTVRAVAHLPQLETLDLSSTGTGVDGMRALAAARTLRRLAIAFHCAADVAAAARALGVEVAETGDPYGMYGHGP